MKLRKYIHGESVFAPGEVLICGDLIADCTELSLAAAKAKEIGEGLVLVKSQTRDFYGETYEQYSPDWYGVAVLVDRATVALEAINAELLEALAELADLMDDIQTGNYTPDSFTTQPARAAIAKAPQGEVK